jgi:3alpha(or 20beta)-hydroxysteroid dehydrogenase
LGRVEGKVALVSGAARGMGAEFAKRLLAEGASVVLGDVLDAEGAATQAELGGNSRYIHLDVTQPSGWKEAVALAVAEFGALDVLVNNAGIVNFGPIDEYTLEMWNAVIAVNLTGTFLGMQAAIPELKKSTKSPSIVNMSSITGLQAFEGLPGYAASKFGIRGLTKAAALDLGKYGIRVNSVHPGTIRTPMTDGLGLTTGHVALNRIGEPSELANLVLFLASDEASFSTGAEFLADGGEFAGLAHLD